MHITLHQQGTCGSEHAAFRAGMSPAKHLHGWIRKEIAQLQATLRRQAAQIRFPARDACVAHESCPGLGLRNVPSRVAN